MGRAADAKASELIASSHPDPREDLLGVILENATVGLFVMNESQQCVYMNPAAETITGFTLPEVQGKALHDVIHHTRPDGSHYPLSECPIDQAFPQNNREQGEEVFVRKDGTFYPVSYTASPVRKGDAIVGTVLEVIDISERKRDEAHRRGQAETLATINKVATTLSAELDVEKLVQAITDAGTSLSGAAFGAFFYNQVDDDGEAYSLYTLSGVPREAFAGFPMPRNTHVFGPTFRGEGIVRSDDITKDERYGRNPPYHGMPAGHLPVRSYLALPVTSRSGSVLGGLFFGHPEPGRFDERVESALMALASQSAVALDNARLYEEARRLNENLERQVERRTAELRALTEELEAFNYSVSHDLRAPLRGIDGFAQILADDCGEVLSPEGHKALERIRGAAGRMSDLIEELLKLSRLSVTSVRPVEVDLEAIGLQVVAALRERDPDHDVELLMDGDLRGHGDPAFIRIVFENLLGNAWKFTKGREFPRVEVGRVDANGESVFRVSDNGAGFDMAYADRLFRPFQRLHSPRDFEGSGVGLAIVSRIVRRHGGRVWAEGEPGKGASFYFTLPGEVRPVGRGSRRSRTA